MKWGVGRVIYEAAKQEERSTFDKGVNNGKLMILPYYHLNMEKILPEQEDLKVISFVPGKRNEIYCMVRSVRDGAIGSLGSPLMCRTSWRRVRRNWPVARRRRRERR